MKGYLYYIKKYKLHMIFGPLLKLLEAIFELIIPIVMADVIDKGVSSGDKEYIIKTGIIIFLLGFAGLLCAIGCQYLAAKASQGFGMDIRRALFKRINLLSYSQIESKGTSSLITRVTNDVNNIQNALAMAIRLASRAPFLLIGSVIMSVIIDVKLSVIFFITVPLVSLVLYLVMSRASRVFKIIQSKLDKLSLICRENLDGIRVIRAFSKQKNEIGNFTSSSDGLLNTYLKACKIMAFMNPATYLVINLATIAIVWSGAYRIYSGTLMQGQIIALVNYMTQILMSLFIVAMLVMIFTRAYASSKRITDILETKPEILGGSLGNMDSEMIKIPKIEFIDVGFSYESNSEDVLNNVSLRIERNQTIGVIGSTGSGKSTFVNLISRFYDCTKGEILIDGVNIKDYSLESIRNKISIVPQRPLLFSGTIESNIRIGKSDASIEEIKKALKTSCAYDFVYKMPKDINSIVERGGKNLSGGQKQRLTIARAVISNSEILILDDSSSALDASTDASLRDSLNNMDNTTVIIVSQKVLSILKADKILVFDDGKVVGEGTHNQLMDSCEVYKEIYNSQMGLDEVEAIWN